MAPKKNERIQSFTELFHWCKARAQNLQNPWQAFATPWSDIFCHLKRLGVPDADHQFAASIGETVKTWNESLADEFANWQVLDWCQKFCEDKVIESNEVPNAWNTQVLGLPARPVNSIDGLIDAFNDCFRRLQSGVDRNKLTLPESKWARALLDSIQHQALQLGIDVPETNNSVNKNLIQQLRDTKKKLMRARFVQTDVPVGVSLLDAAMILSEHDSVAAKVTVKRWRNNRESKLPQSIGFDQNHSQRHLYSVDSLTAFIASIEGEQAAKACKKVLPRFCRNIRSIKPAKPAAKSKRKNLSKLHKT